jgi:hypothetical protein
MDLTTRGLWTLAHGMGFGGLYLLACSGALVELYRLSVSEPATSDHDTQTFVRIYLVAMVILAWAAVLSGAYVIYPWYRAAAPAGAVDLSGFPQRLLLSKPGTTAWHSLGMEWKEHVAWLTPISITMVAAVVVRYGRALREHRQLRTAVLVFAFVSFLSAGIAGVFGAMIDKAAPTDGGTVFHLVRGQ